MVGTRLRSGFLHVSPDLQVEPEVHAKSLGLEHGAQGNEKNEGGQGGQ